MDKTPRWFAGVDWASQKHDVWLADASGKRLGKRTFEHSGEGLAQMCSWLMATSGGMPEVIHVAIEVPHGAVVETLLDRGFKVYAINPKQLDRFRDRFSPAGRLRHLTHVVRRGPSYPAVGQRLGRHSAACLQSKATECHTLLGGCRATIRREVQSQVSCSESPRLQPCPRSPHYR